MAKKKYKPNQAELAIPVGTMCMSCTKLHSNCSTIDFKSMPLQEVDLVFDTVCSIHICKQYKHNKSN